MSKVMRSVKNVTKGYSSSQVKVREGSFALPPSPKLLADRDWRHDDGVSLLVSSCDFMQLTILCSSSSD